MTASEKPQHTPTSQELHLRSALENEGYTPERIDEIIRALKSHDRHLSVIWALVEVIEKAHRHIINNTPMGEQIPDIFYELSSAVYKASALLRGKENDDE